MNMSFKGFNENTVTFEADPTLTAAGVLVKLTEDGKAAPCAADDIFCGIAVNVRGGYAAVQLSGYAEMTLSGICNPGWQTLAAAGTDSVKSADTGRELLVVESGDSKIGFIL